MIELLNIWKMQSIGRWLQNYYIFLQWQAWSHKYVTSLFWCLSSTCHATITAYLLMVKMEWLLVIRLHISGQIITWEYTKPLSSKEHIWWHIGLLIKRTIKALITLCCQRAANIIFITNTWFISECVSVMIMGVLTPWSLSKLIPSKCGCTVTLMT